MAVTSDIMCFVRGELSSSLLFYAPRKTVGNRGYI
uniref:Uncharacterized protein n=1 Tax=Siphoviridae sp. ctAUQ2 TaxID=2826182 RepID=A0A8S5MZF5_9CAUD|nr:MAG TPA: hypothetical protein [Siphoviridae sp. ctAUQ2]